MLSTLLASATAFPEVELTFPNLFGGITLSYYQGFELFGIKIYWYGVLINHRRGSRVPLRDVAR